MCSVSQKNFGRNPGDITIEVTLENAEASYEEDVNTEVMKEGIARIGLEVANE